MRDIAFLVYPGYSLMALAIVAGFEVANSMADPAPYELKYLSEHGGPIRTSAGLLLETEPFTDKPFDPSRTRPLKAATRSLSTRWVSQPSPSSKTRSTTRRALTTPTSIPSSV